MKDYNLQIEKLLFGELTKDETEKLMKEIDSNPSLKREYLLRKEVNAAIGEDDVLVFRERLNNTYKENFKEKYGVAKRIFINNWKYAVAASIALLVISSVAFIALRTERYTSDQLYATNFKPYDNILVVRSGNVMGEALLKEALTYYDQRNYMQAVAELEKYYTENPDNLLSGFYLAISLMETDHHKEAVELFQNILKSKTPLLFEQAEWYLALCYLKMDDKDHAKQLLHQIAINQQSSYQMQAAEILRRMKK